MPGRSDTMYICNAYYSKFCFELLPGKFGFRQQKLCVSAVLHVFVVILQLVAHALTR